MRSKFLAVIAAALVLAGCSSTNAVDEPAGISVANVYVKATDTMMTGAFMDVINNTDADVTLTGATADFAEKVEVHEVVDGVMRMKEGGLQIAKGATGILEPGGNHLMFLGLMRPLVAGDEVEFTLQFSDGSSVDVLAAVKDLTMGDEPYPSASPSMEM